MALLELSLWTLCGRWVLLVYVWKQVGTPGMWGHLILVLFQFYLYLCQAPYMFCVSYLDTEMVTCYPSHLT